MTADIEPPLTELKIVSDKGDPRRIIPKYRCGGWKACHSQVLTSILCILESRRRTELSGCDDQGVPGTEAGRTPLDDAPHVAHGNRTPTLGNDGLQAESHDGPAILARELAAVRIYRPTRARPWDGTYESIETAHAMRRCPRSSRFCRDALRNFTRLLSGDSEETLRLLHSARAERDSCVR